MFWNSNGKTNGSNGHNGAKGNARSNGSLIEFDSVSKIYSTSAGEFTALKDVDLKINQGELVSIVGKSGSGKTTLINMLTGIDRPTQGTISVGGTSVQSLNEGQRAIWRGKNIGIVFQFFQLLPTLTLLENVRLPMDFGDVLNQVERDRRALELLELVGLLDQADTLPARLSGGQQQRAAIARALANDPPIIATDEPTGNLDGNSAEQVISLFEDLVERGKTILMVTHDDDLAARAPRIIRLSDGEIID
ncbi:MAG: ABC transporter ATP-binding protein [Anaerolineales bacterium]|jgi:putative ABC transport system ATP-binding protein